jgi:hypothetical protein
MFANMMSQALRDVLTAAGWAPDRSVPTSQWIAVLEAGGFSVVPAAEAVLRNFGGLTVRPAERPSGPHAPETIVFDPLATADREAAEYWEEFLGKKLTPIAEVGGQSCLLVAESGEVYTSWDRFLFKDGDSLEDALENTLVFGRRRPVEIASME